MKNKHSHPLESIFINGMLKIKNTTIFHGPILEKEMKQKKRKKNERHQGKEPKAESPSPSPSLFVHLSCEEPPTPSTVLPLFKPPPHCLLLTPSKKRKKTLFNKATSPF